MFRSFRLRRSWEEHKRDLNLLLEASASVIDAQKFDDVRDFIENNEFEVAYSVLKDALDVAGFRFEDDRLEIQGRLEARLSGKDQD
ncbi:MAG: hypothetical protein ACKO01_12855 [Erythrobacter sp.]